MKQKIFLLISVICFMVFLIFISYWFNVVSKKPNNTISGNISDSDDSVILYADESNFEDIVLNSDSTVFVEFYTSYCTYCKAMQPEIEYVSKLYPQVKFVKVNAEKNINLAQQYNVMAYPTNFVFKNGQVLRFIGYLDRNQIIEYIK